MVRLQRTCCTSPRCICNMGEVATLTHVFVDARYVFLRVCMQGDFNACSVDHENDDAYTRGAGRLQRRGCCSPRCIHHACIHGDFNARVAHHQSIRHSCITRRDFNAHIIDRRKIRYSRMFGRLQRTCFRPLYYI